MKEIRLFIWLVLLTGLIYPYSIYLIGNFFFKEKAHGDFITHQNKLVGAKLIGQNFESDSYFFSRPSATEYMTIPSGASNLGPTNLKLRKLVQARREKMENAHNTKKRIPPALLFASGSGLDPHIDLETAYFQIDRIVKSRKLDPKKGQEIIKNLIDAQTKYFIDRPYVNVLLLNLSLDEFLNLETAVRDDKVMQDFELESFTGRGRHSLVVKAPPTRNDSGSKDCVNLSSPTAVSRLKGNVK